MNFEENVQDRKKPHRDRHSGRKADKKGKKEKTENVPGLPDKQRNPKAFTFNSAIRAERRFRRTEDIKTKKQHIPVVDRTPLEPPPIMVVVVGPPKVGKSTLIQCLVKNFTRQPLTTIKGPVTVVSGKKRRITLMECNNDINSMIDMAKVADLVLLLIDASFGFEMEIFEFLNICQVHGMPKVMGVLTHLDSLRQTKVLQRTKKLLKHRFWTEVYAGAKLFYLSGVLHGEYLRNEVNNLGRFMSVMKFRPLTWQTTHPYILADRMEDLTPPETIRQNCKADRTVSLYGYVRGIPLNKTTSVHIPGCGDLPIRDVSFLPDPCPLPERLKKRSLVEKERFIYAPFSGVGGIVYDKDAVYIELAGSHSHSGTQERKSQPHQEMVSSMLETRETLDEKMTRSQLQLFSGAQPITAADIAVGTCAAPTTKGVGVADSDGRSRRKVVFPVDDDEFEESLKLELDQELGKRNRSAGEEDEEGCNDEWGKEETWEPEKKRKKRESEENTLMADAAQREKEARHRGVLSEKDKEIKSKISTALAKLEAQKSYIDSAFSDNEKSSSDDESDSEVNKTSEKTDSRVGSLSTELFGSRTKEPRGDSAASEEVKTDSGSEDEIEVKSEEGSGDDLDSGREDSTDDELDLGGKGGSDATGINWKDNLARKASNAYLERQATAANLWKLVYGTVQECESEDAKEGEEGGGVGEVGGLFRVISKQQQDRLKLKDSMNALDVSKFPVSHSSDWSSDEVRQSIADCFVTGKWKSWEDAGELLRLDDASAGEDEDEEVFGDFEDLETGERHKGDENAEGNAKKVKSKDGMTREELMEKKRKLKEKFDADYDDKDGEGTTYYDELKQGASKQAELNRTQFETLDNAVRVQLEGYRAGMYVRVEVAGVPCELLDHFDPTYPLILGGLQPGEENIGYVNTRIKKHRWYKKILKTKNPLIVSVGWRRFQTLPVFSKQEDNMRYRMLKYTPEHVTCMAHFWGPITRAGTGILAVQDVATKQAGFRIVATGTVVDTDQSTQVTKKLKLTGTPLKVYKKTAFIKGMFTTALEVARFESARVKTVSGIRGQIKKAVNKPEGAFRATFEDKIQLSDIVFCRTWYRVEVPKLYIPVISLLLPMNEKNSWRGVKTLGQLKRERGIKNLAQDDSLYTPIEREPKVFRPLVIPRGLQRELPYKDKPKHKLFKKRTDLLEKHKDVVVRDHYEEKVASLMTKLRVNYADKQEREKQAMSARMTAHQKKMEAEEKRKMSRQKVMKKDIFRTLSKMEAKEKKMAAKRK